MRSNLRGPLLLALITASGLVATTTDSRANALFFKATGLPCGSCHLPGMELQGPKGLNPAGQTFWTAYQGQCNTDPICAKRAAFPPPATPTTETVAGTTTFRNTCGERNIIISLRMATAALDQAFVLVLQPNTSIAVGVPKGSMFAWLCGAAAPIQANAYHYINVTPTPHAAR